MRLRNALIAGAALIVACGVAYAAAHSIASVAPQYSVPCLADASDAYCQPVSGSNPLPTTGGGGGGGGGTATAADPTYTEGTSNPLSMNLSGYQRVILPSTQLLQNSNTAVHDCSASNIGTAQNIIASSGNLHGFIVMNIDTTEGMWINLTTTAAANTVGSYFLQAASASVQGGSFSTPFTMGTNGNVSAIAATSGHKYSCTWW